MRKFVLLTIVGFAVLAFFSTNALAQDSHDGKYAAVPKGKPWGQFSFFNLLRANSGFRPGICLPDTFVVILLNSKPDLCNAK
jgi:hypothetical protein